PNGNTANVIDDLLAKVEKAPLPAPSADRAAGPGEVLLGIIEAMYSKFSWQRLTGALAQANKGDGSAMVKLADQYLQRESDGSYPNLIEANSAVNYVDEACSRVPNDYIAMADRLAKTAPHFGASAASSGLTCAFWGAKADPLTVPRAAGAPPIVVIGTTNDPATPYEWSVALSNQLESGRLVTHRGEGHTIYAQGDSCIDAAVNAYLLELTVPKAGLSCGTGAPPPETVPGQTPRETPVPGTASGSSGTQPTVRGGAPGPPNTGQGRDNGSVAIVVIALSIVLAAGVVAGGVVIVQRR
ncbi:MAG: alpha/beta hydrolase, partial [Anaerolineaceae bacterium]